MKHRVLYSFNIFKWTYLSNSSVLREHYFYKSFGWYPFRLRLCWCWILFEINLIESYSLIRSLSRLLVIDAVSWEEWWTYDGISGKFLQIKKPISVIYHQKHPFNRYQIRKTHTFHLTLRALVFIEHIIVREVVMLVLFLSVCLYAICFLRLILSKKFKDIKRALTKSGIYHLT